MSATIKSTYYDDQFLDLPESGKEGETWFVVRHTRSQSGSMQLGVAVSTADLHAALGIDELGCGCDEADENLKAAIARAEKAEATIARVRELDWRGNYTADYVQNKIAAALDPKPAFVLPTEAGAGICARIRTSHEEEELRLFSTGLWMSAYNGAFYTPESVMDNFTDHRLIGAES